MTPLHGDLYHRWEEQTREASCRGLEGLLPPPAEWPSFLDAPSPPLPEESIDRYGGAAGWSGSGPHAGGAGTPEGEGAGKQTPEGAQTAPRPSVKDLPETRLPEDLRAEIEDFLNRDRPTQASDDEVASLLKGGFDPNVDPKE